MFKEAKKFANSKKIDLVVTGEVVGQRPMSQQKKQIEIIEKESGLNGRIFRPLIAAGITGRQRKKQIELAKKFRIKYPHPAGGCLLCEKLLKKRFEFLFERGIAEKEICLINIGRHFVIDDCWVILGRNKEENEFLKKIKIGKLIVPEFVGPGARVLPKSTTSPTATPKRAKAREVAKKINKLIQTYSKKGSEKDKKRFEDFRI